MSKSTVLVDWLDDCPRCGNTTAYVSGPGYRTPTMLVVFDSVECARCGHKGEIDADGENAWVEWSEADE